MNYQKIIIALFCYFFMTMHDAQAQTLPPCFERPGYLDNPWVNAQMFCLEQVLEDNSAGELGFTALAAAPDGTLYAARPMTGEVLAITDTDGDLLPDRIEVAADGLTLPNGLTYYENALYISGGSHIYRLQDGQLEILVDDVPSGAGFWTGDLTIGDDERIYIATGSACVYDSCDSSDQLRGAILSYALDGSDRQTVMDSLREPIGVAFFGNSLWTVDSQPMDGLVSVDTNTPALTFTAGSRPSMVVPYTGDTLPTLQNTLLVVLRGTSDHIDVPGFAIAAVQFDESGNPTGYNILVPAESDTADKVGFTLKELSYRMSGFWPHSPMDVAVSREGWLYISVGGGRILVLRPNFSS
jgi:glucose/arabinose dehydrogenase